MLDPKNTIVITGGVVQDPELVNGNILKLRLAVDYAGSEKNTQNNSGYFDVTYYLNDEGNRNATFVKSQIDDGKMKKGSQVQIVGRLVQERWSAEDGGGRSRVVIVAEALTYAGGGRPQNTEGGDQPTATVASSDTPPEF